MKKALLLAAFVCALALPSFATVSFDAVCTGFGAGDRVCTATQAAPWHFTWVNQTGKGLYQASGSVTCTAVANGQVALHLTYYDAANTLQDLVMATAACDGSGNTSNTFLISLTQYRSFVSAYLVTSGDSAPLRVDMLLLGPN